MKTNSAERYKQRQKKLGQAMQAAGLDAVALIPGSSLGYMTGLNFHLMERPTVAVFYPEGPPTLVLPQLEAAKLEGLPYDLSSFTYGEDPSQWHKTFEQAFNHGGLGKSKVGVEKLVFRFYETQILQQALPEAEISDASEAITQLRIRKDPSEIEAMQQAVNVAQAALKATLPLIKIGMQEQEVAAELVLQLFRNGSDTHLPFQPIIGSGPNSANPHAFVGARQLAAGDLVVIDFGGSINGYLSDITRTFAVAEYSPEQEKIHQTVQQANAAARALGKPGVTCGDMDKAARDVIEQAGYGEYFFHRTGHGLGMDGHEEPYIRAGNDLPLQAGMTFTIEPGIYIAQKDGVRIEDDVVITEDGLHSFSDFDRGLQVIG